MSELENTRSAIAEARALLAQKDEEIERLKARNGALQARAHQLAIRVSSFLDTLGVRELDSESQDVLRVVRGSST